MHATWMHTRSMWASGPVLSPLKVPSQSRVFPIVVRGRRGVAQPSKGSGHIQTHGAFSRRLTTITAASSTGTVRIIIQGRNLELTQPIREYAESKVSKAVEHFEQSVKEVDVSMSVRGGDTGTKGNRQHKVEVTVRTLRTGTVRAECVAESMYASIDLVCDKVQRNLRKVKEKAIKKGKWPGRGGERGGPKVSEVMDPVDEIDLDKVPKLPEIVRTKYHFVKALTEEEAVDELEKLDHDFYLYRDAKDNDIRLVYKRRERGYGIIIPVDSEGE